MKISIVVPIFNGKQYLEKCFDSIFAQNYKNFEVTVVDGYSTDGTWEVLDKYKKKYPKRLRLIYSTLKGESEHINEGMQFSKGDIVAYLCADDTYEPECFERVAKYFNVHPKAQWVYGRTKIIDSEDKEIRGFITKAKEMLQSRYNYNTLGCVNYIAEPSVFMRKSFYQQVGEYNKRLAFAADYDYWLRAGRVCKPGFINRHLANWRAHSGSISVNKYKAEAMQAFEAQKRYSNWWFRPIQWVIYLATVMLYLIISGKRHK